VPLWQIIRLTLPCCRLLSTVSKLPYKYLLISCQLSISQQDFKTTFLMQLVIFLWAPKGRIISLWKQLWKCYLILMFNYYYQKSYNRGPVITTSLTKENCASAFNRYDFNKKVKHIFQHQWSFTQTQLHYPTYVLPNISVWLYHLQGPHDITFCSALRWTASHSTS